MSFVDATATAPADPARTRAAHRRLRLGTRGSALALAQSGMVAEALRAGTGCDVELVRIVTAGDRSRASIDQIGGTGVFVSALRDALLDGEVDLAVHSLKDLPTATPAGIVIAAVPPRASPFDVLVSPSGRRLADFTPGTRIGTGSPRRAAQLHALGLGLEVVGIRGNVDTRIKKAIDGEVDAVVLAHAGLDRLDRLDAATELLDPGIMLPAPGQGALAIECAAGRGHRPPPGEKEHDGGAFGPLVDQNGPVGGKQEPGGLAELLRFVLDDTPSSVAVRAERAFLAAIEAGCTAPVGALAEIVPPLGGAPGQPVPAAGGAPTVGVISLRAVVASPDGRAVLRRGATGPAVDPEALGQRLADELLSAGAHTLMGIR